MATLELYKERPHNIVKMGEREFKIPVEYTVEEVERVIEQQAKIEELSQEAAADSDAGQRDQLRRFWDLVFIQIATLVQHYHPEVTAEELRKLLTQKEALSIINFQKSNRFGFKDEEPDPKKKSNPERELEALRRMIVYLVAFGFTLLDVRKLYIDELYEYHKATVFLQERRGDVEKGTYEKVIGAEKSTVDELRSQLFKINAKK